MPLGSWAIHYAFSSGYSNKSDEKGYSKQVGLRTFTPRDYPSTGCKLLPDDPHTPRYDSRRSLAQQCFQVPFYMLAPEIAQPCLKGFSDLGQVCWCEMMDFPLLCVDARSQKSLKRWASLFWGKFPCFVPVIGVVSFPVSLFWWCGDFARWCVISFLVSLYFLSDGAVIMMELISFTFQSDVGVDSDAWYCGESVAWWCGDDLFDRWEGKMVMWKICRTKPPTGGNRTSSSFLDSRDFFLSARGIMTWHTRPPSFHDLFF